jgi:hypothetical protein
MMQVECRVCQMTEKEGKTASSSKGKCFKKSSLSCRVVNLRYYLNILSTKYISCPSIAGLRTGFAYY